MAVGIEALVARVEALLKQLGSGEMGKLTVTYREAGKMLGRSARTISRMERRGEIQSVTVCGQKMIPTAELRRVATPKAPARGTRRAREKLPSVAEEVAKAREMLKRR